MFGTCIQLYIPLTPACESPRNLAAVSPRACTWHVRVHVTSRGARGRRWETLYHGYSHLPPRPKVRALPGYYGSLRHPAERARACELRYSRRGELIETARLYFLSAVPNYPRCETTNENIFREATLWKMQRASFLSVFRYEKRLISWITWSKRTIII